jgi:hypothetical protein
MALAAVIFAQIGQISFYLPLGNRNFVPGADAEHHTRDRRAPQRPTFHALFEMIFEGGFYVPKDLGKNGGSRRIGFEWKPD